MSRPRIGAELVVAMAAVRIRRRKKAVVVTAMVVVEVSVTWD